MLGRFVAASLPYDDFFSIMNEEIISKLLYSTYPCKSTLWQGVQASTWLYDRSVSMLCTSLQVFESTFNMDSATKITIGFTVSSNKVNQISETSVSLFQNR